jgi:hypothetical protein
LKANMNMTTGDFGKTGRTTSTSHQGKRDWETKKIRKRWSIYFLFGSIISFEISLLIWFQLINNLHFQQ